MEKQSLPIKFFLWISVFSIVIVSLVVLKQVLSNKTRIVFCDVGQGDATYIRVINRIDILIDAGPKNAVLRCLGKYMPLYDRTIELAILSHPQDDHYGGFLPLLDRYRIKVFIMNPVDNPAQSFQELKAKLFEKHVSIKFMHASDKIKLPDSEIEFYWPTTQFISHTVSEAVTPVSNSPAVLGEATVDLNAYSLIFVFQQNNDRILFTGDATPGILNALLKQSKLKSSVLKIPHHGSKNGLTPLFLDLADPRVIVISVGRKNRYGHPSPEIISLLSSKYRKYLRTDEVGDVIFELPLNKKILNSKF